MHELELNHGQQRSPLEGFDACIRPPLGLRYSTLRARSHTHTQHTTQHTTQSGVFSSTECVLYRMCSLQNVFSTECVLTTQHNTQHTTHTLANFDNAINSALDLRRIRACVGDHHRNHTSRHVILQRTRPIENTSYREHIL